MSSEPATQTQRRPWSDRRPSPGVLLLLAVSYIPLLLTKPGKVGADTKTYLYLDPGRLLSRAPYMWDPNIGLGTVTHQNIGYLWPMGPYYFVMDALGLPDWVAQRLWMGSIIFAAGMGVRWMLRELNWRGTGVTVAAFAYALSPYILEYAARISVILLPFAGLPWLIGLAVRCLRRKDWASPAVFALVTLTVGGVNATSLVLVMVGPILWFVYATFVLRESTFSNTLIAGLKISVLTLVTSLWWLAGLMIQGTYGIPILRYTETYKTVADAALGTELLRGLGYWFFYGQDGLGPWTASSITFVQAKLAVALSFFIPGMGLLAAIATRWRTRLYFAIILAAGLVLGIGAHPWETPTPYGSVFKTWSRSDLGLSFRSTPRAAPLIVLALAVFLGGGVAAISKARPSLHRPVSVALLALILLNMVPLFRGQLVDRNLMRDESIPEYWTKAADALSAGDRSTRALEFPGIDFAAYRWGNTVDPITPGLTDREFVARELIPYGTPASANLLNALDAPFQAGRADASVLAPVSRLMGIGDIVFRADLQYERYLTPRPRETWAQLLAATGLGQPQRFGPTDRNNTTENQPVDDSRSYAIPIGAADPPQVSIFPVEDARSILRAVDSTRPVILAGDGDGVVGLAASGDLDPDRGLFYSASYSKNLKALRDLAGKSGASLVVTDTNRRQARRWGSVRENSGYTERPGETSAVKDLTDNRLALFPDAGDDTMSVSEQIGGATLSSSRYGNEVTYTPGDRAVNAMDGDESTAWRVAAFAKAEGEFLDIDLNKRVRTDRITLLQGQGAKNRWMTAVSLRFDSGKPIRVELGKASRVSPGQEITFPTRSFKSLRITVEATDIGPQPSYRGISDVGLAEVTIPGVDPVHEVIRPPTDLLGELGASSLGHDLSYIFTRRAPNQSDVLAADEEPSMSRRLENPVARSYSISGKGRLSVNRTDAQIDELLGLSSAATGGIDATSSARMPGSIASRARSAVDGDLLSAYISPVNHPAQQLSFTYPNPVSINSLALTAMVGRKYSIPTRISLDVDGTRVGTFDAGSRKTVTNSGLTNPDDAMAQIDFATGKLTGTTFSISIDAVEERHSKDWFSGTPTLLPIAVNEVGLPAIEVPADDSPFSTQCRDDLLTVDGAKVPLRLSGTYSAASTGGIIDVVGCAVPARIESGTVDLVTGRGTMTGFDLDLLTLRSTAGGDAATGASSTRSSATEGGSSRASRSVPVIESERTGRLSYRITPAATERPYWLILGQSRSDGWTATTSDGRDLGKPVLINGFANGWRVDPADLGPSTTIELRWTPQRMVWTGLGLSAVGVLVCLALALWPRPRGRDPLETDPEAAVLPALAIPQTDPEVAPRPLIMAMVVVMAGILGTFFGGPVAGAITAVASVLAVTSSVGRWLVRAASLGLFAAAFGYVTLAEALRSYPIDFKWVANFEVTHSWSIVATSLFVVSIAVDALVQRTDSPSTRSDTNQ